MYDYYHKNVVGKSLIRFPLGGDESTDYEGKNDDGNGYEGKNNEDNEDNSHQKNGYRNNDNTHDANRNRMDINPNRSTVCLGGKEGADYEWKNNDDNEDNGLQKSGYRNNDNSHDANRNRIDINPNRSIVCLGGNESADYEGKNDDGNEDNDHQKNGYNNNDNSHYNKDSYNRNNNNDYHNNSKDDNDNNINNYNDIYEKILEKQKSEQYLDTLKNYTNILKPDINDIKNDDDENKFIEQKQWEYDTLKWHSILNIDRYDSNNDNDYKDNGNDSDDNHCYNNNNIKKNFDDDCIIDYVEPQLSNLSHPYNDNNGSSGYMNNNRNSCKNYMGFYGDFRPLQKIALDMIKLNIQNNESPHHIPKVENIGYENMNKINLDKYLCKFYTLDKHDLSSMDTSEEVRCS
jgi:hypothetical protein